MPALYELYRAPRADLPYVSNPMHAVAAEAACADLLRWRGRLRALALNGRRRWW